MPVEVRELIIKTEIKSQSAKPSTGLTDSDKQKLKQQIIDECLRTIRNKKQRNSFNR